MNLQLTKFFDLIKAQLKPYEEHLTATMQDKVNWIRKMNGYDLSPKQKESIERDKALIVATENYITNQQKIISYLFEQLEQARAISAAHFADKIHAEQTLINYISEDKNNGEIRRSA